MSQIFSNNLSPEQLEEMFSNDEKCLEFLAEIKNCVQLFFRFKREHQSIQHYARQSNIKYKQWGIRIF